MEENLYANLSLQEKAAWIQEKGQFIEAQDFYSFFVLIYLFNKEHIKLLYDFSGSLVSIESAHEDPEKDDFLTDQLMSEL